MNTNSPQNSLSFKHWDDLPDVFDLKVLAAFVDVSMDVAYKNVKAEIWPTIPGTKRPFKFEKSVIRAVFTGSLKTEQDRKISSLSSFRKAGRLL